jgi:type I restriction enzyme R subunit
MLDHFIHKVYNTKKLKGKAKGMVVTQNIETAIRYYFAMKKSLEEKGNPFKIIVAFSGKAMIDGVEYTEDALNGFSGSDIDKYFDKDEYRLLIVANKFLTGFDQPKLCAMYVDKKLQGVLAVQALSRLNRSADALGKKSEDLFILDFVNSVEDIKEAFDPFYTATTLSSATDINVLHELKELLDSEGVYEWYEVEEFNEKYFKGCDASELSPIIDKSAQRFNQTLGWEEREKADYKIKAKQFVKIYGQMAAIIPFEVVEWEKLFWFLKFLIPKMHIKEQDRDLMDNLLDSVDLSTYGLERVKLNCAIELDKGESELDPQNPNPRGVHDEKERDPLDEIIEKFNEKWFNGWSATPEERRVKFVSIAKKVKEHPDFVEKYLENPDHQNRELAFIKIVDEVINQQRRQELELYKLFAQDEAFQQSMRDTIKSIIGKI